MPARRYFYHLKFELYDSPTPTRAPAELKTKTLGTREPEKEIYLPPPRTDIFTSNFPVHARPSTNNKARWRENAGSGIAGPVSESKVEISLKPRSNIIDCSPSYNNNTSTNQGISPENSFWPQGGLEARSVQHTAELAVQDWRFGPVRVEGIDMSPLPDRASSKSTMSGLLATTNSGAKEAIRGARGNINEGPRSHTTKARFEPLDDGVADGTGLKNTELGWGIVHLYRDGEETPELGTATAISQSPIPVHNNGTETKQSASGAEMETGVEPDTTILCIPAVPSYMTPSDFLGWVGEKTREEVSHFRMVMTGRMNRYLVLMKFRDAAVAKKWRQDWYGRVFGGLEVCLCISLFISSIMITMLSRPRLRSLVTNLYSQRTAMSCSLNPLSSKHL